MNNKIAIYTKISPSADIKIEPFDPGKRYTKPHRHNKYLELVYFTKGTGVHYMDQAKYAIEPPVVFIISKDEVHHWEIDTEPRGYVIIVKEDFLEKTLDKKINLQLQQLNTLQVINVPKDFSIDGLFEILSLEIKEKRVAQEEVIEGALKALLGKIIGYATSEESSNMGDKLFRFNAFLGKQLKNNVSYYAALLNTSSQNLNSLCKRQYSRTASEVIAASIITEAKRLLRFTNLSVTEIAYRFEFRDVSHFIKYFKRHEGKTPMQFKKS